MKKERTPEQIAARRAKSKERREAKRAIIEPTEANLATIKANFKVLLGKFERGELSIKDAGPLFTLPKNKMSNEELQAKIEKQRARLARLEAALRG